LPLTLNDLPPIRPRGLFTFRTGIPLNISKHEQRTLHALAQGGRIDHHKNGGGDIIAVDCITRDGWRLVDCSLAVFRKLRKRRFIRSEDGGPYRVTRDGLLAVRAQLDNR
jgi:uncharacterized protein YjhX (UPF0386 family)